MQRATIQQAQNAVAALMDVLDNRLAGYVTRLSSASLDAKEVLSTALLWQGNSTLRGPYLPQQSGGFSAMLDQVEGIAQEVGCCMWSRRIGRGKRYSDCSYSTSCATT